MVKPYIFNFMLNGQKPKSHLEKEPKNNDNFMLNGQKPKSHLEKEPKNNDNMTLGQ